MVAKKQTGSTKVGMCSRIDYGSSGYRQYLVNNGFEIFRKEGTNHNVLGAGLVAGKELKKILREKIDDELKKEAALRKIAGRKSMTPDERINLRAKTEEAFVDEIAEELVDAIPKILIPKKEQGGKKHVPLFITTSPAYDGEIGERIARLLVERRDDIKLFHPGSARLTLEEVNKDMWFLAPTKAIWRSEYYSTPAEREIKDKMKSSDQGSPDRFVVGGLASSLHKEKGELNFAYETIPALHRLEAERKNENQVGVRVVEYIPDNPRPLVRTYSLKDLTANELRFVTSPDGLTRVQRAMVEIIKDKGWSYDNYFVKELEISEEEAKRNMAVVMSRRAAQGKKSRWPGIRQDEANGRYYFNLEWIRHKLKCPLSELPFDEDVIASYGCLHAGSTETDYRFFREDFPKIILARGATIVVAAGDIIEGMEHDLDRKREVIPGMANNTIMEEVAARMNATVLLEVFEVRFKEWLTGRKGKQPGNSELLEAIRRFLPMFYYIHGNHDLWQSKHGILPLKHFHRELVSYLNDGVRTVLTALGHPVHNSASVIEAKVALGYTFQLPSGITVMVQHPHMARSTTTSMRPQQMLENAKKDGCKVSIGANFHVSMHMEEYDMDMGQCVSQEIGTIKHGSNFERNKLKTVDQGVGYLRLLSRNGEIFMSEAAFFGGPRAKPFDSDAIVNSTLKSWGFDPLRA